MLQERTLSPPPLLAKSRHVVPTILRGHSGKFSNGLCQTYEIRMVLSDYLFDLGFRIGV